MVVSYPNPLYNRALMWWHSIDYPASTRGGPRVERLWINYKPPVVLHDSRFVGANKRQRERIMRRRRNWIARLRRGAGKLERQSILDAIQREFSK